MDTVGVAGFVVHHHPPPPPHTILPTSRFSTVAPQCHQVDRSGSAANKRKAWRNSGGGYVNNDGHFNVEESSPTNDTAMPHKCSLATITFIVQDS